MSIGILTSIPTGKAATSLDDFIKKETDIMYELINRAGDIYPYMRVLLKNFDIWEIHHPFNLPQEYRAEMLGDMVVQTYVASRRLPICICEVQKLMDSKEELPEGTSQDTIKYNKDFINYYGVRELVWLSFSYINGHLLKIYQIHRNGKKIDHKGNLVDDCKLEEVKSPVINNSSFMTKVIQHIAEVDGRGN